MKVAICTIIKDSQNLISEFCEHHFNIGVDDIYLFEDYKSVSHREIVNGLNKNKKIHLIKLSDIRKLPSYVRRYPAYRVFETVEKQNAVYNYCLTTYKNKYDWIAFIDDDEHLIMNNGKTLKENLLLYNDYTSVYLHWKMFKTDSLVKKDGLLSERINQDFSKNFDGIDKYISYKSIVNCKKINKIVSVHLANMDGVDTNYHNFDISTFSFNTNFEDTYNIMYINHYYLLSLEEWKNKILNRGDLCINNRTIDEWYKYNNYEKN